MLSRCQTSIRQAERYFVLIVSYRRLGPGFRMSCPELRAVVVRAAWIPTFGQFEPVWLWVRPALIATGLSALGIL